MYVVSLQKTFLAVLIIVFVRGAMATFATDGTQSFFHHNFLLNYAPSNGIFCCLPGDHAASPYTRNELQHADLPRHHPRSGDMQREQGVML